MKKKQIEKICAFYASDWHLVTMILPYINKKIDEKTKVITILENDIKENIKTLVNKLNIKNKQNILNINWISSDFATEEKLNLQTTNDTQNIILINGSKKYIDTNNYIVENWFKKSSLSQIKIINFFEATEFNNNILEILNAHNKILNTSGETAIEEVFTDFERNDNFEIKKVAGNNI